MKMNNSINGFRAANLGATARAAAPAGAAAAPQGAATTGKLGGDTRVAAAAGPAAVGSNAAAAVTAAEVRLAAAWLSASA
jgi:hypothetical protein